MIHADAQAAADEFSAQYSHQGWVATVVKVDIAPAGEPWGITVTPPDGSLAHRMWLLEQVTLLPEIVRRKSDHIAMRQRFDERYPRRSA